ncbi:GrpB family protein [Dinoroseobacter sp. S76]|uniref:GrpB family protein n=1 Tax=Dinoroseobacter sp. S76 TaxID=3415124 RepID=UPI003C7A8A82
MSGIRLAPHDPGWAGAAAEEGRAITHALGGLDVTVHHIGSTSVPGLVAKPILDLLLEADDMTALAVRGGDLAALGYEGLGAYLIPGRLYFRKEDPLGRRTHHLHAFATGSEGARRHLAFRDYLRAHPEVAREYGALKQSLVARTPDPEHYMDGKDPWVKATEAAALHWAGRSG